VSTVVGYDRRFWFDVSLICALEVIEYRLLRRAWRRVSS
jgi:hypothetical protein